MTLELAVWNEQLNRALRRNPERARRFVRDCHEVLDLLGADGEWTDAADRRARQAFGDVGRDLGLGDPPWD
jgi:hypothetical protein